MFKRIVLLVLVLILLVIGWLAFGQSQAKNQSNKITDNSKFNLSPLEQTPSPTPTPIPLTFEQMNQRWGPCARLPVLLYHHIENLDQAKAENHLNLTVSPEYFREQMNYLKEKGYTAAGPAELTNFFDQGTLITGKSIIITFDDGYDDFAQNAAPVLKELGLKAIVFLPTGLMNNPGYLSWNQIADISQSGVSFFGNHTWSHYSVIRSQSEVEKEILTADRQLADQGLNNPKIFAYPYGQANSWAENYLSTLGYKLAFTTKKGSVLCQKQRLELPRIRIGNAKLSAYGI